MTITEIANQIVLLIDRQAAAIANDDFNELEALTAETGRLLQSLDAQVESLTPGERDQLVGSFNRPATNPSISSILPTRVSRIHAKRCRSCAMVVLPRSPTVSPFREKLPSATPDTVRAVE